MSSLSALSGRDLFAEIAIREIPKLLTLQDRNPHSPTYGCFDRNYWHYKVADFPCGMSQEFVWPLALVFSLDLPNNPYCQNDAIRECVRAGILFAVRSSHSDGSCDDYFPNERALGATAFSFLACMESCGIMGFDSDEIRRFIERRGNWLAESNESGRLTNHHALVALGLNRAGRFLKIDRFINTSRERLAKVLAAQTSEGWFPEYEGFDPGYDTLTLSCLAALHRDSPDDKLADAIQVSVNLLRHFVHPDGSFGGEYGSRNTCNFFPHGFELAGRWLPEALAVNDQVLAALKRDGAPCYSDDRIIGHHLWNYLLAARDYVSERPHPKPGSRDSIRLAQAGIIIDRRDDSELYVALNKGGVFKLFRDGKLVLSDTGISLQMRNGKVAVPHLIDTYHSEAGPDRIVVRGQMGWAKQSRTTPLKLIVLRLVNLTIGRIAPDLVRALLQKLLIVGKQNAPFRFHRTFERSGKAWRIVDRIEASSWQDVESAGIAPAQTSIYVAMSRTFQSGQLQPWIDLNSQIHKLKTGEPLVLERNL